MKIIVNGERTAPEVFEQELDNQRRQNPHFKAEQLRRLAQQSVIDWTIIRQQARKAILSVPPALVENEYALYLQRHGSEKNFLRNAHLHKSDIPKIKQDIETNIKVKQLLLELTKDLPQPTDEEVSAYYHENRDRFVLPEQIHAAHIVMRPNPAKPQVAFEEMRVLRQRLLAGEDFAALAAEHSSCQDDGGDLGWFAAGKMVAGFDAVVFSMNVGEISPVFQTEFGFHIATVYDKKAQEPQPLAAVRQEIVETLKTERGDDFIAAWVDDVKAKAVIQIEE